MRPEAAARFAATREPASHHLRNALQILGVRIGLAEGLSFDEAVAVRDRCEAALGILEEGRKIAGDRVALLAQQWARKYL